MAKVATATKSKRSVERPDMREDETTRLANKDHELRSAIESSRKKVIVLAEPGSAVSAEVELGEEGDEHCREDGRVDSDGEVAEGPAHLEREAVPEYDEDESTRERQAHDGSNDLISLELGCELMDDPEGDGDKETDDDGDRDNEVWSTRAIHRFSEGSPRDSLRKKVKSASEEEGDDDGDDGTHLRVERLDLLSTPDVGSLNVEENLTLGADLVGRRVV
jgi:hypothetical protein